MENQSSDMMQDKVLECKSVEHKICSQIRSQRKMELSYGNKIEMIIETSLTV